MRKTRIVYVGTRTWQLTNQHLDYFLRNDANIVAYVESPLENIVTTTTPSGSYKNIHDVAIELGKPLYCPKTPKDPEFIETIKGIDPDVIIVCGYQFYIPETVLNIPRQGVVNFHTSLLPRHCGRHPGFQTIWYGDKETGMTLHYMDAGLDTGDIISDNRVPVLQETRWIRCTSASGTTVNRWSSSFWMTWTVTASPGNHRTLTSTSTITNWTNVITSWTSGNPPSFSRTGST